MRNGSWVFWGVGVLFSIGPTRVASAKPAKIIIIGIDAASRNVLEPYAEQGAIPNLAQLMKAGARGHLESYWPERTPQVWTSVATGKLPGQHGVWDHVTDSWCNPPEVRTKERVVRTSADRRSRALWSLLSDRGIRSLVVGWMVTWPAETVENAVIAAPVELLGDRRQTTIKASYYEGMQRWVTPSSLEAQARSLIVVPGSVTNEDISVFADVPGPASPLLALPYMRRYLYTFRWSLARTRSVENLATGLYDQANPDVLFTYFQCPDTFGHRFWIFKESEAEIRRRLRDLGIDPKYAAELKRRFGGAYEACYRDLDRRIGHVLEKARGPDTLVLVVSDHGFGHVESPHPFRSEPYGGVHLDQGAIIAAGPGIKPDSVIEGASVMDLTPTILHYLGAPVARDMRGKVIEAVAPTTGEGGHPVAWVETFEAKPQTECPYAEGGYPPRKGPKRPTSDQMNGRNPFALSNSP